MKRPPQIAEELEEEEVDKLLFLEVLVFKFSNFTADVGIFLWLLTFCGYFLFTGEEEEAGPDSSEDEEASSSGGIGGSGQAAVSGGSGQAAVSGGTGFQIFKLSNLPQTLAFFVVTDFFVVYFLFTGEEEEAGPDSSEDEEASSSGGNGGGGSGQAAAVTSISGGTGSGRSRSTQASGSRLSQVTGPWKKENSNPLILNYSGVPGPTGNVLSTSSSLIDAFYIFFTVQVWDLLVTETNTYGARIIPGDWVDTYVEEIEAFIGMLIVMGVAKLPSLEMYWSSSDVDLAPSLIRNVMPRDRFRQLLRCLHVNAVDPSLVTCTPNYDRLYKVRKLLDLVFPLFESAYTTHKELSIDEAMIPYTVLPGLRIYPYFTDI